MPDASPSSRGGVLGLLLAILQTTAGQWATIIALIFGGCCRQVEKYLREFKLCSSTIHSNAWTLELVTTHNPRAGSLITFAQFLIVAVLGIKKRIIVLPDRIPQGDVKKLSLFDRIPRIRPRPLAVPISRWLVQVILFLGVSSLNNAAFGYRVPMAVHIVFRSGGLVVNMILGWLVMGRRYRLLQVIAVILISVGIGAATASGAKPSPNVSSGEASYTEFSIGISMLSLALVLSTFLGFSQESTYGKYGRHWEEGMFLLHFLALPMFAFMKNDLVQQIRFANASERISLVEPVHAFFKAIVARYPLSPENALSQLALYSIAGLRTLPHPPLSSLTIPSFWIPLLLNVVTQFICVSGVNRLTSRVSSLTVTLVLSLRKAVSLIISVVIIGRSSGSVQLWGGSAAVLIGTVLYTLGRGGTIKEDEHKADNRKRR